VVVSSTLTPNFYPLTAKNIAALGIKPVPPELQTLPDGLQFIGVSFFILALLLLVVQEIVFMQLAKREGLQKKGKSTKLRQDYDLMNQKEGIL
jgi:hypothetical protein